MLMPGNIERGNNGTESFDGRSSDYNRVFRSGTDYGMRSEARETLPDVPMTMTERIAKKTLRSIYERFPEVLINDPAGFTSIVEVDFGLCLSSRLKRELGIKLNERSSEEQSVEYYKEVEEAQLNSFAELLTNAAVDAELISQDDDSNNYVDLFKGAYNSTADDLSKDKLKLINSYNKSLNSSSGDANAEELVIEISDSFTGAIFSVLAPPPYYETEAATSSSV